jgi:hypothetical protein
MVLWDASNGSGAVAGTPLLIAWRHAKSGGAKLGDKNNNSKHLQNA